jgi:hypothetical protein
MKRKTRGNEDLGLGKETKNTVQKRELMKQKLSLILEKK